MAKNKKEKSGDIQKLLSSLGDEFGIDKNLVESFKPIIPKLIIDFLRGAPKFVEEEKKIDEIIQRGIKEKTGLLIQNIYSARNFLLTLMGFSLTIIGIVSPNKSFFHHVQALYFGLALLALNIVGSVIYLLYIHTVENNKLFRHLNFDRKILKEIKDLLVKTYSDPMKTFDNYMIEKEKLLESKKKEEEGIIGKNDQNQKRRNWSIHILCYLFLGGLLLIAFSFFWQ